MSHTPSNPHETYHPSNIHASTPPPPPPKPSVHEPPLAGLSPLPLPPRSSSYTPWHSQSRPEARPTENIRAWDHDDGVPEAGSPQQYRHPHTQQSEQQTQQPRLPEEGWVPDMLKDMSKTDLHTALTTPSLLHSLLHSPSTAHPALPASTAPLTDLLDKNAHLATYLLTLSAALSAQRASTSRHLLQVRALESQWKRKQKELEGRLEVFGPRVLHQRLRASIGEAEAWVGGVEESFLEGEGREGEREVGEWVKRVREGRRIVWLRRERRGRWDEGRVGGWR